MPETDHEERAKAAKIRVLNDALRVHALGRGSILITAGVQALGEAQVAEMIAAVQHFNTFSKDNDPYQEHDFGAIDVAGETIFWKIDYYDLALEAGSPDPADEAVTHRVLTIMLASEY